MRSTVVAFGASGVLVCEAHFALQVVVFELAWFDCGALLHAVKAGLGLVVPAHLEGVLVVEAAAVRASELTLGEFSSERLGSRLTAYSALDYFDRFCV